MNKPWIIYSENNELHLGDLRYAQYDNLEIIAQFESYEDAIQFKSQPNQSNQMTLL